MQAQTMCVYLHKSRISCESPFAGRTFAIYLDEVAITLLKVSSHLASPVRKSTCNLSHTPPEYINLYIY